MGLKIYMQKKTLSFLAAFFINFAVWKHCCLYL